MIVADLILAAGEAKRFGYPKQILKWKDSTILGTVITEATEADFDYVYVVLGAHYEKIKQTLTEDLKKVKIVYNKNWQEGMSSSIKVGFMNIQKEVNPDYILVQLGDMPFINKNILNQFIKSSSYKPDIVIAVESNRPAHPYMIHKKYFNEIIQSNYPDGMRSFFKKYFANALKIEVNRLAARQDIDTWDKYEQLSTSFLHNRT